MVNKKNISQYEGSVPTLEHPNRKITGTPIYSQLDVLALIQEKGSQSVIAWTRKCKDDLQKYELDADDILRLIPLCFSGGTFLGSEWCQQSPNGCWAACDAYRIYVKQWTANANKDLDFDFEYYIKFAIGKTGQLLLLISCHLSENKR
jgi:hypothetical protein